jgi:ATP-dependent RNA helicase DeaD
MLNMGFIDDIETIFKQTNPDKRVIVILCNYAKRNYLCSKKYMGDYDLVAIKKNENITALTEQFYIQISERDKLEALCRIMDKEDDFYGIVFCKTKLDVDHVFAKLHEK